MERFPGVEKERRREGEEGEMNKDEQGGGVFLVFFPFFSFFSLYLCPGFVGGDREPVRVRGLVHLDVRDQGLELLFFFFFFFFFKMGFFFFFLVFFL